MSGGDEVYTAARTVLLDALEALETHRAAITLVGAQAIYIRVGEADIAVAPTTTDGDLMLDPRELAVRPALEELMRKAGFERRKDKTHGALPGIWQKRVGSGLLVSVDLLVPEAVASQKGRRAARLEGHETGAALKVRGLEGALVDADVMTMKDADGRSREVRVAGPAALLVAKVHKILDRTDTNDRLIDKDALDVFRLLRGTTAADIAARASGIMNDERARATAAIAFDQMHELFGRPDSEGVTMAIRGSSGLISSTEVSESLVALTSELGYAMSST